MRLRLSVAFFGCLIFCLFFSGCGGQRKGSSPNIAHEEPILRKNPYASKFLRKTEKPKLCLNMIVKNESKVIRRCLDSVIPLIDYWVILDTGSVDGTQDIIQEHLKNIPGELYESSWKTWGKSRTEAFELARDKGEYILFMDADDVLSFQGLPSLPSLKKDQYKMWRGWEGVSYEKPQIVKGDLPWKWVGVTHEYLDCEVPYTSDLLENVRYLTISDGASSEDPQKFKKNVFLLKEGLKEEPDNSRYVFYLAESYRCCRQPAKAIEWFQKRVEMGGWPEEVFWSKLQIAHMLRDLGLSSEIVLASYKDALAYRPHRPEPVYFIAELCNSLGRYPEAYAYLKAKLQMERPDQKDALFNLEWIEDYGLLFQLSICAYYVGQYQEALDACDQLLDNKNLPESWRTLTERNRTFPLKALNNEKQCS